MSHRRLAGRLVLQFTAQSQVDSSRWYLLSEVFLADEFCYGRVLDKISCLAPVCAGVGEPCVTGISEVAVPALGGSSADSLLLRDMLCQLHH